MRKLILIVMTLAGAVTASAATITLTPSTLTPFAGTTFTIGVSVSGNTDEILGFGFNATTSDPSRASFVSASINPFFDPAGAPVDVSAAQFPGATSGTVDLAMLTFLAGPNAGPVMVGIQSLLSDPNQGLIYLNLDNEDISSSITIGGITIPEPGSFTLMMLASAAALAYAGRRLRA